MSHSNRATQAIQVPHPIEILHSAEVGLACGLDGQILADELHGLFAGDTRVLSTYKISISGRPWNVVGRSRLGHATASWEMQNPQIREATQEIPPGCLLLSLRRRVDGGLHDDLRIVSYFQDRLLARFALQLDADFSDIFEVKQQTIQPRLNTTRVDTENGMQLVYERQGFRRALHVDFKRSGGKLTSVGSLAIFEVELVPREEWTCCVEAIPEIDGRKLSFRCDPHGADADVYHDENPIDIRTSPILQDTFDQSQLDLRSLSVPQENAPPFVAAGAPWFLTLFGRDSLMTSLMTGLDGAWSAHGALNALRPLQARKRDDWRDAEPGKILHELRQGELTFRGIVPHSPYYGTHDAPELYCLALWNAWRWTGDRKLIEENLEAARAALRWCEKLGDRDGDGFLEYETRSRGGYRNQSWKDAGDAILYPDGTLAKVPLALCELQGYWFAALLAMAELFDETGDSGEADRARKNAFDLRSRVMKRFWMDDANYFALGLDRDKQLVRTISSNPGHLLWCGLPTREKARAVCERMLQKDLFSGWGIRTLSSENGGFNPLSYQSGSVWPHDTLLAAAGFWRYGFHAEAETLIRAILDAASAFEQKKLPELFCGTDRGHGLPVPYSGANLPQAWAAAAPILATQLFLGIIPDAARKRCVLAPRLPEWLPDLEVRGIAVGKTRINVRVVREGERTKIEHLEADGLEISEQVEAMPLWGKPLENAAADQRAAG